ncbi:MAG TPA: hypothetical protein VGF91_27525 [Solirubrobacteraceae bacterium]|jgi:hypothetical protein
MPEGLSSAEVGEEIIDPAVRRLRAGCRPAFNAWLATHPLKNPNAPPDPSYMPQYRIPQEAQGRVLTAQADSYFTQGKDDAATTDKYDRLTVLLAAVLFLVGIGSRFPLRAARYGLIGVALPCSSYRWCSSSASRGRHRERRSRVVTTGPSRRPARDPWTS